MKEDNGGTVTFVPVVQPDAIGGPHLAHAPANDARAKYVWVTARDAGFRSMDLPRGAVRLALVVLVALVVTMPDPGASQSSTSESPSRPAVPPGERFNVTARDGTTLAGEIRFPNGAGPHPAILLAHGFGQDRRSMARLATEFTADGYVTVTFDARGFGESGGFVGLDGPNEVSDVGAWLDALARVPQVLNDTAGDPRVGLYGTSYGGALQLLVAAADERADAVVVQSGWNDLFAALFPDGVLATGAWGAVFAFGLRAASRTGPGFEPELVDLYNRTRAGTLTPDEARPYLAPRSPASVLDRVRAPVLLLHGRADGLFPATHAGDTYAALLAQEVPVKLVLGPEGHGRGSGSAPPTIGAQAFVDAWFGHWLRGDGNRSALLADPLVIWNEEAKAFQATDDLAAAVAPPASTAPATEPLSPSGPRALAGIVALALLGFVLARRRP